MLTLRKIAVTGPLASGKSTVCTLLQDLGCELIQTDKIVHELLAPNTYVGKQVIALLGPEIVVDSCLDRKKIAEKVFQDEKKLKALEKILHPVVLEEMREKAKISTSPFFVVEIPLLYEIEEESFFDIAILVTADSKICKQRLRQKHMKEDEYEKRMAFQLSLNEKKAKADFVIENNGSLQDLKNQVNQLYQTLSAHDR